MKKIYLLFYSLCCILHSIFAQNPLAKQWDYRYGGTDVDFILAICRTTDGGCLMGGFSFSDSSGDKTQPNYDASQMTSDFWIVKVDSLGKKEWDKDFGSTDWDQLWALTQTSDGGYLLGGYTSYLKNGDVSQVTYGAQDYWIVRLDASGNKKWDKRYGGAGSDVLTSLEQTRDGGYILGGRSASGIGGDKTTINQGGYWDYWIVKIDSLGNKKWDKDYGGTGGEDFESIIQAADGGYLLGGSTVSGIGGDKTEANWDASLQTNDYWVVKVDSNGNKQWDRDFGGTNDDFLYSVLQTPDKGFLLGGWSNSDSSGNKSENNKDTSQISYYRGDFWIVKIDSLGNKQWDKSYGGWGREDEFDNMFPDKNGGYILAGTSYSEITGDKTEMNMGHEQTWIIKIDSSGKKLWDKTLLTNCGSQDDEGGYVTQTNDGCYVFSNYTLAGVGGDKTQASQGENDMWIIKFCDTINVSVVPPSVNFLASDTLLCADDCINFSNLSSNANSYQWYFPGAVDSTSTVQNPQNICYLTGGIYNVTLIAYNAGGKDSVTFSNYIHVKASPPTPVITQLHDTLICSTDPSYTSYQWFDSTTLLPGATDTFLVVSHSGNYNVHVTNANECNIAVGITVVLGIHNYSINDNSSLYPNPVGKAFTVYGLQFTVSHIEILNVLGQIVQSEQQETKNSKQETLLDVSLLPAGIYFVQLIGAKERWVGRFVKE